ncbi:MAG: hypothetical protein ACPLRA_04270, partial [Candidatus Saccharicenans sp.]
MKQSGKIAHQKNQSAFSLERRSFLNHCGKCLVLTGGMGLLRKKLPFSEQFALVDFSARPTRKKVKLRLIYALHSPKQYRPDWPNLGFDFRPVMESYERTLRKRLPEFTFLTSAASGPEEAVRILKADETNPPDGYLVFQLNCWNQVIQAVVETGRPVLYVDFEYGGSGGFLVYTASLIRQHKENFGFICSSDFDLVISAVRAFVDYKNSAGEISFARLIEKIRLERTPRPGYLKCYPDKLNLISAEETVYRMKNSTILLFGQEKGGQPLEIAGLSVLNLPFSELNQAWERVDRL